MSVEEARRPIEEKLGHLAWKIALSSSQPEHEIAEADDEDRALLDRLILEVQAAMPCCRTVGMGNCGNDPCPVHRARARLASTQEAPSVIA